MVCPFPPRLLASHMAGFVIWSVYHFLVTPSRGYRSQSPKLMSPGNQEHRSHGILSNRHLAELFADSYSCLLSSRLFFSLFLCLFVCFFLSFFLSSCLYLSASNIFYNLSSVLHSSLLYVHFSFCPLFLM